MIKTQKENIQQNSSQQMFSISKNLAFTHHDILNLYENTNDPRYKFLLKNGKIQIITNEGQIIIIELPNIPGTLICYRKPSFRDLQADSLKLDGLDINSIPLLEGEENIKYLSLQKNNIQKIENMISLPSLVYLNLRSNNISKIDNLQNLTKLKVLNIQKNSISYIKNLDALVHLEVLNLVNNKIKKIDQLQKLKKLKVIKLGDNYLTKIENLDENTQLVEIDFKNNKIENIENIFHLKKLQKLNLSLNNITQIPYNKLKLLTWLESLSLFQEGFDKKVYQADIIENLKNIKFIDENEINKRNKDFDKLESSFVQKSVNSFYQKCDLNNSQKIQIKNLSQSKIKNEKSLNKQTRSSISPSRFNKQKSNKTNNNNLQKEIEKNMNQKNINLIQEQWKRYQNNKDENQKLNGFSYNDDKKLYLYGNNYDQLLTLTIKYPNIEHVQIQYCDIQTLSNGKTVNKLKKFKFLKRIDFLNNNITQMNQLTFLESLENLESLNVSNNPVSQSQKFDQFLLYRFPQLQYINNNQVDQNMKSQTKNFFINFDKQLQIQSKYSQQNKQFLENNNQKLHSKEIQSLNDQIDKRSQYQAESMIQNNIQKQLYNQMFDKVLNGYLQSLDDQLN